MFYIHRDIYLLAGMTTAAYKRLEVEDPDLMAEQKRSGVYIHLLLCVYCKDP